MSEDLKSRTTINPGTEQHGKADERWRDWEPAGSPRPSRLLTRQEVAEHRILRYFRVTPGNLRYWEHLGVLPRATRQWHRGATRAVYPPWYPLAVFELLDLKEIGVELKDAGQWLKARMSDWWSLDPQLDADKYLPVPTRLQQVLDEFAELVGELEGDRITEYALHLKTSSSRDLIRLRAEWFQGRFWWGGDPRWCRRIWGTW